MRKDRLLKSQLKHLFLAIGEIAFAVGALSIAAAVSLAAFMRLFDPNHYGGQRSMGTRASALAPRTPGH
jgi:hypothetical protein